jgi:AraC family transcriptional regulator, regulatory protein of adaptative response / DNA-3-methyladenine glycosylase II
MRAENRFAGTDRPLKRVVVNLRTPIGSNALHGEETAFRDKPELDPAICWQAIYSRDRRFDGRIFAGVLTTGVYCRPICPVPLRKPANVRWYPSAASAEAAGFRPCRRCRPHTSPGTPAWLGTSAVVSRALKLISEGALDADDVEALAERVGLGSRHLRRLFLQHLGASPVRIASTRRVHFARNLLDQTDLPITKIASYSGFKSIRQFNHSMRTTFDMSPSELRALRSGRKMTAGQGGIAIYLTYRPPFDWRTLIRFLKAHATPGTEVIEDECYRRSIEINGQAGEIEVRHEPDDSRLRVRVTLPSYEQLMLVVERVRRIFDLGADPLQITNHLAQDSRLGLMLQARPGRRVPGVWDTFELAVRAVLGQQLTFVDSKAVIARLVRTFGRPIKTGAPGLTHLFPRPEVIASGNLSSIVMPPARAETLRALARATCQGKLNPAACKSLDDIIARLSAIHGMGRRPANYIAMRAFGEPDAFPSCDLGLRRALTGSRRLPSEDEFCSLSESWRPWRAYAAICLWAEDADHSARGGGRKFLSLERPESRPIPTGSKEHQNPTCVQESDNFRG